MRPRRYFPRHVSPGRPPSLRWRSQYRNGVILNEDESRYLQHHVSLNFRPRGLRINGVHGNNPLKEESFG